jgi:hypothetical protein
MPPIDAVQIRLQLIIRLLKDTSADLAQIAPASHRELREDLRGLEDAQHQFWNQVDADTRQSLPDDTWHSRVLQLKKDIQLRGDFDHSLAITVLYRQKIKALVVEGKQKMQHPSTNIVAQQHINEGLEVCYDMLVSIEAAQDSCV